MLQDHTNGEFVGIGDCRVTRARPAVLSATVVNNDYTDESATSTQFPASYPLLSDGLRIRGMLSRLDIEMRWSRHGKRQDAREQAVKHAIPVLDVPLTYSTKAISYTSITVLDHCSPATYVAGKQANILLNRPAPRICALLTVGSSSCEILTAFASQSRTT